jgi:hypothetical protein
MALYTVTVGLAQSRTIKRDTLGDGVQRPYAALRCPHDATEPVTLTVDITAAEAAELNAADKDYADGVLQHGFIAKVA